MALDAMAIPGETGPISANLLMQKAQFHKELAFFLLHGAESGYAVSGGLNDMTKADLVEKVTRLGT